VKGGNYEKEKRTQARSVVEATKEAMGGWLY